MRSGLKLSRFLRNVLPTLPFNIISFPGVQKGNCPHVQARRVCHFIHFSSIRAYLLKDIICYLENNGINSRFPFGSFPFSWPANNMSRTLISRVKRRKVCGFPKYFSVFLYQEGHFR